jgi:hypothetical protein
VRLRSLFTAALTGALLVGTAWAGVGIMPVSQLADEPARPGASSTTADSGRQTTAKRGAGDVNLPDSAADAADAVTGGETGAATGADLGPNELLVGAAKINLEPKPDASKGEVWVRDKAKCMAGIGSNGVNPEVLQDHAADWRSPWIENTNCLYMGGFGVGPSQPITEFDKEFGLWARTAAFKRGDKTLVLTILDAEGYNGLFTNMCPPEKACGAIDIGKQMGTELGIDPAGVIIASTHAHSGMDLIGGWGGVPPWYMRQVAEAIRESIRQAVATMEPATLEAGDTLARQYNGERRDSYYSAEDQTLNWIRAVDRTGEVVTTVGTYAAHATSHGSSTSIAHADWPGVFDKAVEDRFGGIGLMFEAGLGNMSASQNNKGSMGAALAELLPPVGEGTPVPSPDVKVAQTFWNQPVTNGPLGALGAGGFFDRRFEKGTPGTVEVAKKDWNVPCRSASPITVRTQATAARIGGVVVAAAPGEIFSNYSNTIEERSTITALSIGQANDALGYMPQSFETDDKARQGGGFAGGGVFEYEDAYAIDRCFGDMSLQTTLDMLAALK